jgi:FtsH-binding integral membrane protein
VEKSRFDRDRMLFYAVLLCELVSAGLYAVVYLTMAFYSSLNDIGLLIAHVALFVTCGALGIALVLALTARSSSLSGVSLSGFGWLVALGGLALLFPALAASRADVPALGGTAGAIFLTLSGALLLQAERAARDREDTPDQG